MKKPFSGYGDLAPKAKTLINVAVFIVVVVILGFRSGFMRGTDSETAQLPRYILSEPLISVRWNGIESSYYVWVEAGATEEMVRGVLSTVVSDKSVTTTAVDGKSDSIDRIDFQVFNRASPETGNAKDPDVDKADLVYRWSRDEGLVKVRASAE